MRASKNYVVQKPAVKETKKVEKKPVSKPKRKKTLLELIEEEENKIEE